MSGQKNNEVKRYDADLWLDCLQGKPCEHCVAGKFSDEDKQEKEGKADTGYAADKA